MLTVNWCCTSYSALMNLLLEALHVPYALFSFSPQSFPFRNQNKIMWSLRNARCLFQPLVCPLYIFLITNRWHHSAAYLLASSIQLSDMWTKHDFFFFRKWLQLQPLQVHISVLLLQTFQFSSWLNKRYQTWDEKKNKESTFSWSSFVFGLQNKDIVLKFWQPSKFLPSPPAVSEVCSVFWLDSSSTASLPCIIHVPYVH